MTDSLFNYSRPPKTPRRKEKEVEHKPRMPFAEFKIKFLAFCERKRQRAIGNFEEDVDIDSEIPEDIAKDISQTLAQ